MTASSAPDRCPGPQGLLIENPKQAPRQASPAVREIAPRCELIQSDTPRKARGLMNWAASKAVGLLV
jgi:hypothetical protein